MTNNIRINTTASGLVIKLGYNYFASRGQHAPLANRFQPCLEICVEQDELRTDNWWGEMSHPVDIKVRYKIPSKEKKIAKVLMDYVGYTPPKASGLFKKSTNEKKQDRLYRKINKNLPKVLAQIKKNAPNERLDQLDKALPGLLPKLIRELHLRAASSQFSGCLSEELLERTIYEFHKTTRSFWY